MLGKNKVVTLSNEARAAIATQNSQWQDTGKTENKLKRWFQASGMW